MRLGFLSLSVVLLAGLAGNAAADTLRGLVVEDHTNNPLASVEVRVYQVGVRQLAADLETDSTGRFAAEGLPAGEYRIEALKPNYVTSSLRMTGLKEGMLIRLVRCGVIAGQVLDARGQPIRGASVYAIGKPAEGTVLRPFDILGQGSYTRVNERGQYRLHGLPPGEYSVAVSYGASTATFGSMGGGSAQAGLGSGVQFYPDNARPQFFAVTGGEEYRADFAVIPSGLYKVTGKVDQANAKTRYWLALTNEEQPALATAVAETQIDGSFEFEGVASGSYQLTASGPIGGYGGKGILRDAPLFGRIRLGVGGGNVEGVSVPLQKGRTISFLLRAAMGDMRPGTCPATAHLALAALEDWATQIDRSGEVSFQTEQTVERLAPARYQIQLSGLGESCYQPASATLDLSGAFDGKPVAIAVAPAGSIHGRLTGTTSPGDFAVALVPGDAAGGAQAVQVAFPDHDGRFAFGGLRPGTYRIAARRAGEGSKARWVADRSRSIEIRIAAGAPTELELPAPPPDPNQ
ncbi:MAG TPA: carboxypeptidase-like regulatory domain-containing protein [Bryobacteraceae bacterium]|nr:carboxypeptidase-like regulatory domain-containing protein [Bryobacteraceae bacterium]